MGGMRARVAWPLVAALSIAAEARTPTAVHGLAERRTSRWTADSDPLTKISGACRIAPAGATFTLECAGPPGDEPRAGRQHFYTVVLFRDLEETLYAAACARVTRNDPCDQLKAGQTFSAEVDDRTLHIVFGGEQLPLRIFEKRPRAVTIDSPTRGTPSKAGFSAGTPSAAPYSQVAASKGTPSGVQPSEAAIAAGAPARGAPSEVAPAVAAPTAGRLHVYCSVGSAQVYVDTQLLGRAPVEAPVLPGRHTITVRARGFRDWSRTVEVPAGRVVRLTAELRR